MRFFLLGVLVMMVGSSCAPVLRFRRPTAPEASLAPMRTFSVKVKNDVGQVVTNAVLKGLAGEVPVPVPVDRTLQEQLITRIRELGYEVCPAAPCGDGELNVSLTEADVGTWIDQRFVPHSKSRLVARVVGKPHNGTEVYDYVFRDSRNGSVAAIPELVRDSAAAIVARFASTLLPGSELVRRTLEDGSELEMGVNMLLSGNWQGAIAYFNPLVQQRPDLHGAWFDLGVAYEAQGDWNNALAAYEQAAARDRKRSYLEAVSYARTMAVPPAGSAPGVTPTPVPAGAP